MKTTSYRLIAVAAVFSWLPVSFLPVHAQEPAIQRIESSGLLPGQKASITIYGAQLKNARRLWTSIAEFRTKEGYDPNSDGSVVFEGDIPAETRPGIYVARVITAGGCSEAFSFILDDLTMVALAAESEAAATPQAVPVGSYVVGLMNAVKPRFFRVAAKAGQTISVDVFARRLSSELDPVLQVTDPAGREVAFSDDVPGLEGDAALKFTAAADGEYRVQLRDVKFGGGPRHFFHLRIGQYSLSTISRPRVATIGQSVEALNPQGEPVAPAVTVSDSTPLSAAVNVTSVSAEKQGSILLTVMTVGGKALSEVEPNDTKETATAVSAEHTLLGGVLQTPGDVDWFSLTADSAMPICITAHTRDVRSPADVVLQLWSSDGKMIAEADDAAPLDAQLVFSLPAAGQYFLRVSELASLGGPEWTYDLEVNRSEGRLEVVLPADRLQVPRGGSAALSATVKRINYDGPIVLEALQLPASLTMAPVWLAAKQTTVPLVLTSSATAEPANQSDSGVLSLSAAVPDRNPPIPVSIRIASPPPKKAPADSFRSIRARSDAFVAVSAPPEFSFVAEPAGVVIKKGASGTVTIKAVRHADWKEPIDVALVTKPDQLPAGVTVPNIKLEKDDGVLTISAAADAAVGKFTLFVQGTAKKDKATPVHPVPPIAVEITE